jgi:hypothetical protein
MKKSQKVEAAWTLESGPLDSAEVAQRLLMAVGEIVAVAPARYDLDRRGKWREYEGRRLIVDMLTQRTQLVTIAEDRSVEEGGVLVMVATGKQGPPPQAVAQWRRHWPPSKEEIDRWRDAVDQAFDELHLAEFTMSVDGDVVMRAAGKQRQKWHQFWNNSEEK